MISIRGLDSIVAPWRGGLLNPYAMPSTSGSGSTDLKDLLAESQKLVEHIKKPTRITRTLRQLEDDLRRFRPTTRAVDPYTESRAQMFYGDRIDIVEHGKNLRNIDVSRIYESQEPLTDLDVEKFLKHEHQLNVNTAIEESIKITAHLFRKHHMQKMEEEWDRTKRNILEEHVVKFSQVEKQLTPMTKQIAISPAFNALPARYSLGNRKMDLYANVVRLKNDERNKRLTTKSVVDRFKAACLNAGKSISENDFAQKDLEDCWDLLRKIVGPSSRTPDFFVGYRSSGEQQKRLQLEIIGRVKEFAEELYRKHVDEMVKDSTERVGSIPSKEGQVAAYLRILSREQTVLGRSIKKMIPAEPNRVPTWAWIFYCYRCGYRDAAKEVANRWLRTADSQWFRAAIGQAHADQSGLDGKMRNNLASEFQQLKASGATDPFQKAMYILLQSREISTGDWKSLNPIVPTIDDWMWLNLSIYHSGTLTLNESAYQPRIRPFTEIQKLLVKQGPKHFTKNGLYPLIYFKILLMSLQFERAADYLMRTRYCVDGIHFALALDSLGLLRRSRPNSGLLETDPDRVNLASYVHKYVQMLTRASMANNTTQAYKGAVGVYWAFHYFLALKPGTRVGDESKYAAASANDKLTLLLLSPNAFTQVVGTGDGNPGLLQRYLEEKEVGEIIKRAKDRATERGDNLLAVRLCHLGGLQNDAYRILKRELSRVVSKPQGDPYRDSLFKYLNSLAAMHAPYDSKTQSQDERKSLEVTLEILRQLSQYFDAYYQGRYNVCHDILRGLEIIPLDNQHNLTEAVAKFQDLDESVKAVFGDVAEAEMNILYKKHQQIENSTTFRGGSSNQYRERSQGIKLRAARLVEFVSMVTRDFRSDISSKLENILSLIP